MCEKSKLRDDAGKDDRVMLSKPFKQRLQTFLEVQEEEME